MTIGKTLKRIRKNYGLKQIDMAKSLDIDPATYRKYENGQLIPAYKTLVKIADVLNINVHTLSDADFDNTTAMIRLFQIYSSKKGHLRNGEDILEDIKYGKFNKDEIYISFDSSFSTFLESWYMGSYSKYKKGMKQAAKIWNPITREKYIRTVESEMALYMDLYPHTEIERNFLEFFNALEKVDDYISQNLSGDEEYQLSEEEQKQIDDKLNELINNVPQMII